MRSKLITLLVLILGLATAGAVLRGIEAPLWRALRAEQPALRLESLGAAAGQGVTLGLLGGFRAIVADFTWIRLHAIWEQRDMPATESMLRLVSTIDPRPLYFWLNGARILAFDMTAWRIENAGGYDAVLKERQERIGAEQSRIALRRLDEAMKYHPNITAIWVERANIELNRLHDTAAAAESYRRAWETPGAPYYTARLHGELLKRMGRKADALAWLVRLHPQLPPEDDSAAADVVLARIRELERDLQVSAAVAYRPRSRSSVPRLPDR